MKNIQSELIAEITRKLDAVPAFGALVFEDSIRRLLDDDDPELPDHFIVLQPGSTREVQRGDKNSIREVVTITIVLVTKAQGYAQALRAGRLQVKRLFAGRKCGLETTAVQDENTGFQDEVSNNPAAGQRFAAHAMTLQIGYVQNF